MNNEHTDEYTVADFLEQIKEFYTPPYMADIVASLHYNSFYPEQLILITFFGSNKIVKSRELLTIFQLLDIAKLCSMRILYFCKPASADVHYSLIYDCVYIAENLHKKLKGDHAKISEQIIIFIKDIFEGVKEFIRNIHGTSS